MARKTAKISAKAASAAPQPIVKSKAVAPAIKTPRPAKKAAAKPAAIKLIAQKEPKIMTDTFKSVEETLKKTTAEASEKATTVLKDVTARAKAAFEKGTEVTKEAVAFNKANVEALVEAGKVAYSGAQTATKDAVELTRKNWDANVAHGKALTAVKTPTDFFKMQGDFARAQMDAAVAQTSKSTEFTLKLFGEIMQPIQNRYAVAADQIKARMAA
jgi:phasin family protein